MVKLDFSSIFALSVVFLLLISGVSAQQSCNREQDCDSVSLGREYVTCRNCTCVCWTERGFVGNATLANKCRCVAPRSVYQIPNRGPRDDDDDRNGGRDDDRRGSVDDSYCVDIVNATQQVVANERCERLKNKVRRLYSLVPQPFNFLVLSGQLSINDIVRPDVRSRYTPVGFFNGEQGVIEYYFGAGSTVNKVVNTTERILTCDGNRVSLRFELFFDQTENPISFRKQFNFTHVGYFIFDETERAKIIDINFTNMGTAADIPENYIAPGFNQTSRFLSIAGVCANLIQPFCTGALQQYPSVEACIGFMLSKPYGSFNRANSDSVTCRTTHAVLTPFYPDPHCFHAGPAGQKPGSPGKCVEFPYESYYQEEVENF